jgi:Fe2+ transport system protein FeoA
MVSQNSPVPLCSVQAGSCARICACHLDEEDRELLTAMGLTANWTLRVCRAGEPCIVRVGRTRLGIPRALARRVLVAPTS